MKKRSPEPSGSPPEAVHSEEFRDFMRAFPTGVAVITTKDHRGQPVGMTCSALCSFSLHPPMLLICIGHRGRTRRGVEETGAFAVNLLSADGLGMAHLFASGRTDPFDGLRCESSPHWSLPLLSVGAHGVAECRLHSSVTVRDHAVMLGEVAWVAHRKSVPGGPLLHGFSQFRQWRDRHVPDEVDQN